MGQTLRFERLGTTTGLPGLSLPTNTSAVYLGSPNVPVCLEQACDIPGAASLLVVVPCLWLDL